MTQWGGTSIIWLPHYFNSKRNTMKNLICLIIVAGWANLAISQTKVEKIVPVKSGGNIKMEFKWPELITIRTWERNEVKLIGSVEINKGENDDAFAFDVDQSSSGVIIESFIKNFKNLPRRILIKKGDQEYFFNTNDPNSPEIRKFKKEHGQDGYDYTSHGVIMDINLEVWIPSKCTLDVYSKFGLVEVIGFQGDMVVHSKFGGVDVSTHGGESIRAGTKFGEKYTNIEGSIETVSLGDHPGDWDWVRIGKGNKHQEVKSDFGNVYLRKL